MKALGFEQCEADACVMRLVEDGGVSVVVVVHVDDIFAIGRKSRCNKFGDDLDAYVPMTNLGELRWYAGCRFKRGVAGTVKISQQASAEKIVAKFGVTRGKPTPMVVHTQCSTSCSKVFPLPQSCALESGVAHVTVH